jgi:CRISPR/Cas system-associated exonuclease Cas4 (RecB family)
MTDVYEAWKTCRDADRWADEDVIKLYRAAQDLARYVEQLQGERDLAVGELDIARREIEGQLRLQREMGELHGKVYAEYEQLRAQRAAALDLLRHDSSAITAPQLAKIVLLALGAETTDG